MKVYEEEPYYEYMINKNAKYLNQGTASKERGILDNSVKIEKLTPNIKIEDNAKTLVKFDIDFSDENKKNQKIRI